MIVVDSSLGLIIAYLEEGSLQLQFEQAIDFRMVVLGWPDQLD